MLNEAAKPRLRLIIAYLQVIENLINLLQDNYECDIIQIDDSS